MRTRKLFALLLCAAMLFALMPAASAAQETLLDASFQHGSNDFTGDNWNRDMGGFMVTRTANAELLSPEFTVPADASNFTVSWSAKGNRGITFSVIAVVGADENTLKSVTLGVDNGNFSSDSVTVTGEDLADYAGQTVQLMFKATGGFGSTGGGGGYHKGPYKPPSQSQKALAIDNVKAVAEYTLWSVTIDENLTNGSIAPVADQRAGAEVALTVAADENYEVESVTVTRDDNSDEVAVDGVFTFIMPASDVSVTAVFKRSKLNVAVDENIANGLVTVTTDEDTNVAASLAAIGEEVQVNVTPADGFRLVAGSLKANGAEITDYAGNGVYTFEMPEEDVVVTAKFERKPYTGETMTSFIPMVPTPTATNWPTLPPTVVVPTNPVIVVPTPTKTTSGWTPITPGTSSVPATGTAPVAVPCAVILFAAAALLITLRKKSKAQ